jgi:hypothetical protein
MAGSDKNTFEHDTSAVSEALASAWPADMLLEWQVEALALVGGFALAFRQALSSRFCEDTFLSEWEFKANKTRRVMNEPKTRAVLTEGRLVDV